MPTNQYVGRIQVDLVALRACAGALISIPNDGLAN